MSNSRGVAPNGPPVRLSQRWHWGSKQPIGFLMEQAVQNPDVISLAAGLVDQQSLPVDKVLAACKRLMGPGPLARQALQYGTTPGASRLRELLTRHLATLEGCSVAELGIDINQLLLTTGSQQLLSLVGEVLLDPGDIALVAAPTYFVFLGTLNGIGARSISIPSDDDGMRMDVLEAELSRLDAAGELHRVKLIYLVSYYENPSGVSLSLERRRAAVEIARRWSKEHRILILEDAAYREMRYDGPEFPSIWGVDDSRESVILAQTFSKSFSPGLRVGFGVVPRELVAPLADRKGNEDFGSANFNQHLLATVFEQGAYDDHVNGLRNMYRAKRDCMLAAADKYFRDIPGVHWVHSHGGLYVWMTVPEQIDTGFSGPLFTHAAQVEKVMYVPGDVCYAGPMGARPRNKMRLSFGTQDAAGIDEGMRRLARAVGAVLEKSPSP